MWERSQSRGASVQNSSEELCVLSVRFSEIGRLDMMDILFELWPNVERERLLRYFGVNCE